MFSVPLKYRFLFSFLAIAILVPALTFLWQGPDHHFADAFRSYTPLVEVTILGQKRRFILDTGAPLSVLDEKFRDQLVECPFVKASAEEILDSRLYYPPPSDGRGFGLSDCPFVVCANLSEISRQLKVDIDGVLGVDAIRNYLVVFDPEKSTISMFRNATLNGKTTPLFYDSQRSPVVRGAVGKQSMEFLLDTGSQSTLSILEEDFVALRQTEEIIGPFGEYQMMRLDGTIRASQVGRCRKLTAFGIDATDCVALTSRGRSLGMYYFWRGKLSIDFPHSKVIFQPNSHFSAIDRSDSLSTGLKSCDEGFQVTSISKVGVGFRIGLRVGDRITKVSGRPASDMTQAALSGILSFSGNQDVVLTVLRNGQVHDFILPHGFK